MSRVLVAVVATVTLAMAGCTEEDKAATETVVTTVSAQLGGAELLKLAASCGDGVMAACDALWPLSGDNAALVDISSSCGGRVAAEQGVAAGDCVARFGQVGPPRDTGVETTPPDVTEPPDTTGSPDDTDVTPVTSDPVDGTDPPTSLATSGVTTSATSTSAVKVRRAPSSGEWIVILASVAQATPGSEDRVQAEAAGLTRAGVPAAVLSTDDYPTLNPGFWVVYLDQPFASRDAAETACTDLLDTLKVEDCYARSVGSRR